MLANEIDGQTADGNEGNFWGEGCKQASAYICLTSCVSKMGFSISHSYSLLYSHNCLSLIRHGFRSIIATQTDGNADYWSMQLSPNKLRVLDDAGSDTFIIKNI